MTDRIAECARCEKPIVEREDRREAIDGTIYCARCWRIVTEGAAP